MTRHADRRGDGEEGGHMGVGCVCTHVCPCVRSHVCRVRSHVCSVCRVCMHTCLCVFTCAVCIICG